MGPTGKFLFLCAVIGLIIGFIAFGYSMTAASKEDVRQAGKGSTAQHHQEMRVLKDVQGGVNRIEGILKPKEFEPLEPSLRLAVVENLKKSDSIASFQEIILSAQTGSQNRQNAAKEISEILTMAGLNVQPRYNTNLLSENSPKPIEVACNPQDQPKVEELFRVLYPVLKSTQIGLATSEQRLVGTLHISLVGEPVFSEKGEVQFQ